MRPILNLKDPSDREKFRKVALETALLVKKYKGSLSGEHGDGRLRGEFIPIMYGEKAYNLMLEVKRVWDKEKIFNVGKIVETPPMDTSLRFVSNQTYAIEKEIDGSHTYYNWKGDFDDCKGNGGSGVENQLRALMSSIEQCNGAGDCRKSNLIGGTLCPAYKVSGDETKTTRARANVLREILTNGWDDNLLKDPALKEVLDSCLACKGCKSECPSNVDMTKIRGEVLQHIYDENGTPLRTAMIAQMSKFEKLGAIIPSVYNFFVSNRFSSGVIKKILKFAPERELPKIGKRSLNSLIKNNLSLKTKGDKTVYLFVDEFTNYEEPELGLKFAELLNALGYKVLVPKHIESGRASMSKGCLKRGEKIARKNFELLKNVITEETPLVGIEPSCILSFRDEYPVLVSEQNRKEAKKLGENCLLFDEFLLREIENGRISSKMFKENKLEIWLHGHCHQKSLVGIEKTVKVLEKLTGATVHTIPSGCCGMAGSFGYEKEHYKTSLQIGEMILFPAVREAVKSAKTPMFIAAPGTSCRHQIFDGTGYRAVHPIEILHKWLSTQKIDS